MEFLMSREPVLSKINQHLTMPDTYEISKGLDNAARIYFRDAKARASTADDLKENPKSFVYISDIPGLKSSDITVQAENDNVTIGGERKREKLSKDTRKGRMAFLMSRDPLLSKINQLLTMLDTDETSKGLDNAARISVRDTKAQASTAVDLEENPKSFVYISDIPGLKSSDITVQVENDNVLTIGGERKREKLSEGTTYLQLERSTSKVLRKFTLPSNADLNNISASATDGVLTVNVPKLPSPEPKVIDVMVG